MFYLIFSIILYSTNCKNINDYPSNLRAYEDLNSYFKISFCDFIRSTIFSNGGGGAISIQEKECYLLISYCLFYSCSTLNSPGGAIFFLCSTVKSNISIFATCGYYCSIQDTSSYGIFARIELKTSNFDLIKLEFVSINKCSYSSSISKGSISLNNGNQIIKNLNSSGNLAIIQSGICFGYPDSLTSKYCTFFGNYVSHSIIIDLYGSCLNSLSYLNFVENNSPSYGIIYVSQYCLCSFNYCIFKNNYNNLFFSNDLYGAKIFINNSKIIHSSSLNSGSVFFYFNSTENTNTFSIVHFKHSFCNADIPLTLINSILRKKIIPIYFLNFLTIFFYYF